MRNNYITFYITPTRISSNKQRVKEQVQRKPDQDPERVFQPVLVGDQQRRVAFVPVNEDGRDVGDARNEGRDVPDSPEGVKDRAQRERKDRQADAANREAHHDRGDVVSVFELFAVSAADQKHVGRVVVEFGTLAL